LLPCGSSKPQHAARQSSPTTGLVWIRSSRRVERFFYPPIPPTSFVTSGSAIPNSAASARQLSRESSQSTPAKCVLWSLKPQSKKPELYRTCRFRRWWADSSDPAGLAFQFSDCVMARSRDSPTLKFLIEGPNFERELSDLERENRQYFAPSFAAYQRDNFKTAL